MIEPNLPHKWQRRFGVKEKDGVRDFDATNFDEQVGDFLRRGDRLWIAPPRTPLPDMDEEPTDPWVYVGKMPEGYPGYPRPNPA